MSIKVEIEKSVYGGMGMGRVNGKVTFVEHTLPGEIVSVDIIDKQRDFDIAAIDSIDERSENRIEPQCENAGRCGGCDYLHCDYKTELNIKKSIVLDTLTRFTKILPIDVPEITVINDDRFFYRTHASVKHSNGLFGFFMKNSNTLVPFPEKKCLLLDDRLNSHLEPGRHFPDKEFRIAVGHDGSIFVAGKHHNDMIEKELGVEYIRSVDCFYQSNKFLRPKMLKKIHDFSCFSHDAPYLDICCGIGYFSVYLARAGREIYGFDISKENIKYANKNKSLNRVEKKVFFYRLAGKDINPHKYQNYNVIIDPPRSGMDKKTRHTVLKINPATIIYCSCNPSTFARDCKDLIQGGYTLKDLAMIDMFPATYHIELIALLVNSN